MTPAALLVLASLVSPAAAGAVRPRLHVQMQIEPGVTLTGDDRHAVAKEVTRIWSPVLDVEVSTPGDVPRTAVVEMITLTVTDRTIAAGDNTGLGWIDFVNGEPQPAINVSVAAASELLQAGSWRGVRLATLPRRISRLFLQRTLARAAAHEIGHYLLRTTTHDRRGLMRPVFSVDEIMDGRASLVRLSAAQIARLQTNEGLFARVRREGE